MRAAGVPPHLDVAIRRKVYRRGAAATEAVRDLAFSLRRNETVCMIGPSGAGKTTILRILVGLDRDFEGSVEPAPESMRIGMVFQEPHLLPWRDVETNIRLALPRARRGGVDLVPLLERFGLAAWRDRFPGELSLGMARRVALARALVLEPELVILDEPFVSLDDRAAAELRDLVLARPADREASILMVTHDIEEALQVADRLLLLTARPARVLGEIAIPDPRPMRTRNWAGSMRAEIAARYPTAVLA